ncbi:hypothetical protein [Bradyrhizobium sp. SZCCHNR1015]|uniref:hypothetical protein n=1 Tax=Bradyrhizobium sp. SZCCHNR1015 TaxID=3057338 RepID=UPI002916C4F5|nr:hypothetical protein [Bradyrhizobium sp. SZCCHNR1015]
MIDDAEVPSTELERQILEQLNETIRRRLELEAEENALRRLLTKIRNKSLKIKDVTRKNSVNRVLIEDRILEALRESEKGVSTAALSREILFRFPNVKPATFRSYLHRLNSRGLIEPVPTKVATWQIAQSSPKAIK